MSVDAAAELVATLMSRPARLGASRLLCIDGPAGSGKTTLAAACVAAALGRGASVATVAMDDLFRGWTGLDDELTARVLTELLQPLSTTGSATYGRYDWVVGEFTSSTTVADADVVVLEGCGSAQLAFAAYASVCVWVEAEPELRLRRGIARDGEALRDHWLRWMTTEAEHFAADGTRSRADAVVDATGTIVR